MKIEKIRVRNFKGISEWTDFKIKPITIFIGANSSGKSSAIHALASLSQTFKLPNDKRPLVLDDESADVHLGRFIEVIHTRSYDDHIGIELELKGMQVPEMSDKRKPRIRNIDLKVTLHFKSTIRTQDVYLEYASYRFLDKEYRLEKRKKGYHLLVNEKVVGRELGVNRIFLDEFSLFQLQTTARDPELLMILFAQQQITDRLQRISYLGPFRQSPRRRYQTRGASPREVGAEGEAAVTMLANEFVQTRKRTHLNQISRWMQEMGIGHKLAIQRLAGSDLFDASVQLEDGAKLSIADLGYGISQVLPVLTQCSFAEAGDVLLFEQPELHLHTIPAMRLAGVFATVAREKNLSIVAETHSPDFFKKFITELREGRLSRDDFVAYRVNRSDGCSCFTELQVEDDCEIYDSWEHGLSLP